MMMINCYFGAPSPPSFMQNVPADMIIEKINQTLNKEITQRVIYFFGLTFWTYLMWNNIIQWPHATSSLGISYLTLYSVPALLLFLQIIRNNRLLWGLIFGIVTALIALALYRVISHEIERSRTYVKALDWRLKDILVLSFVFGTLLIANWVIYKIKPKRLI
jgi:hypothetical protein